MNSQEKVRGIYRFVKDNLYLCLPDMGVSGEEFNSTLLFEILSCLNKGKQMLFGEYGFGKTTSSEYIAALMSSMPREVVLASEIRGHPEQTEEKMVARPDLGKLNAGIESVLWSYFVLNPIKIVDEFNRLPAAKQNILLDGIDRGNWKYLSELVQTGDFTLFATCNYEDLGNSVLIEPVLDRFDIATESKRPGLIQLSMIKDIPPGMKGALDDRVAAEQITRIYDSKDLSFREKLEKAREIQEKHRQAIKERTGLELLAQDELAAAHEAIGQTGFSEQADLFYTFLLSELTSCQNRGMKRSNEQCQQGCHYSDFACGQTRNSLSVRGTLAIAKYAQSLAWLAGKQRVTIEEVETVLPYAIWHKIVFNEAFVSGFRTEQRTEPLQLYAAKQLVKQIKQRFVEQMPILTNYVCLMRDGRTEEARKYIEDKDHFVYKELEMTSWVRS
jgi:Mg-chelatase subunit ChlI